MGKETRRAKFPAKKATRNTAIQVGLGAVLMGGIATAAEYFAPGSAAGMAELWQAGGEAALQSAAGGIPASYAAEYLIHRLDDPSAVFDRRTTALYNVVGLVLCFLLFVFPAFQLDLALRPDEAPPGLFGFAALFLSIFLVTALRGLLCNLGLAREEDDETASV